MTTSHLLTNGGGRGVNALSLDPPTPEPKNTVSSRGKGNPELRANNERYFRYTISFLTSSPPPPWGRPHLKPNDR